VTFPFEPPLRFAGTPVVVVRSRDDAIGILQTYIGRRPVTRDLILRRLSDASTREETGEAANPSYSPKLGKKAMDVAESRNLIHGSDCDTESRIN